MTEPLGLRAVEAALEKLAAHDVDNPHADLDVRTILRDIKPVVAAVRPLLAHARALRDVVELGRITLTDNGSFPGKSLDWYRAQALYLRWAPAVLAAAVDSKP